MVLSPEIFVPVVVPPLVYGLGFSIRKRFLLQEFLASSKIVFVTRPEQVPAGATAAVWASGPYGHSFNAEQPQFPKFSRLYVEDGFLRSVGLGADLIRPLSWVFDCRGMYYDASRPSDLEHQLTTKAFDTQTLQRAAVIRKKIVDHGLTKYNVGSSSWHPPREATGKQLVLVAGQVETDAALLHASPGIKTNIELLKASRKASANAWLIYKPHPDVVAGLRNPGQSENLAAKWCDEIVTNVSAGTILEYINCVHVLTSLIGFEALLRGKVVVCHGIPFYAGWGLTQDICAVPRRGRKLSLDELVAGVLLDYPSYVSRETRQECSAEQALDELLLWRTQSPSGQGFWRKLIRPLLKRP